MNTYRFTLEKYRGISTRYTCPQCGRKHTFTRYIDTENNNQYLSDNVGKCNRLDKCGYHYTPKQYFADNPHERDKYLVEDGSLRPCGYHYTPREYFTDNPHKRDKREDSFSFFSFYRENERKKNEKTAPPAPPQVLGATTAVVYGAVAGHPPLYNLFKGCNSAYQQRRKTKVDCHRIT